MRGSAGGAACVLGPNRLESLAALDDSKKLNEKERERLFPLIRRYGLAYHVVFISSVEVDRRGVHVAISRACGGVGQACRCGPATCYRMGSGCRTAMPSLPVVGGDAAAPASQRQVCWPR